MPTVIQPFTDTSLMPFGKYKNKRLIDVPAVYLLWLYNNNCNHEGLMKYITENLESLNLEVSKIPKR